MKFYMPKYSLLLFILCLVACKSDENKTEEKTIVSEKVKEISDHEKHRQNIIRSHNASKFREEEQVRFKIKLSIKDEVFFNGFVTLKTNGSKVRFLDSNIDTIIDKENISTEIDKKLYWLVELYTIGFWLDHDHFNKVNSDSDEFIKSFYKSPITASNYTIYSHPLTDIVQYVDYNTEISDTPFKAGTMYFNKYITVNRIPVSLEWNFKFENKTVAKAEITRISYPDVF